MTHISVNETHQGSINIAFFEVHKLLNNHNTRLYVWEDGKEKPNTDDKYDILYQPSIDTWEFAYFKEGLRIVKYDITCNGDYFDSNYVWIQFYNNIVQGVYAKNRLARNDRRAYVNNKNDYCYSFNVNLSFNVHRYLILT